jgi:hypothetical protein
MGDFGIGMQRHSQGSTVDVRLGCAMCAWCHPFRNVRSLPTTDANRLLMRKHRTSLHQGNEPSYFMLHKAVMIMAVRRRIFRDER